jgi:hypothetical protein
MSVHLVNPSDNSFGTAVITHAGSSCSPPRPPALRATPSWSMSRWSRSSRRASTRGHRRHQRPHRQCAARIRSRPHGARARRMGRLRRHPRHAVPRRGARTWAGPCRRQGRRRCRLGALRQRPASPASRGRSTKADASRAAKFLAARWDLMPPRQIHVGLGPDHPRLPQALLLLQRLAHRRPEAPAAPVPERDRRDRRPAPHRLPLHRPGRRQLLPRHLDTTCASPASRTTPPSSKS